MPTGIMGPNEITRSGLPRDRNTVLIGEPGCDKTATVDQVAERGLRVIKHRGAASEENAAPMVIGQGA